MAIDEIEEDVAPATPESFAPRDHAVEDIAERRRQEMAALQDEPESDVDAAPEPDPEPEPEAEATSEPELYTVKVNGVEKQVTREQLIASYQQDTAAAQRLEAAVRRQKEIEAEAEKLAKERAEFEAGKASRATEEDDDATIKALKDAILEGDDDTLDASLRAALRPKSPVTPTTDADSLAREATRRALYQIDVRNAVETFEKEHPELATDDWARSLVDRETEVVQRDNPSMSVRDVMETAVKTVTSRMAKLTGAKPVGSDLNVEARKAAKDVASKAAVPTAPGAKASIGEEPAPPQTRTDIIEEMKKARGQA